jgi:hypothetical protein
MSLTRSKQGGGWRQGGARPRKEEDEKTTKRQGGARPRKECADDLSSNDEKTEKKVNDSFFHLVFL